MNRFRNNPFYISQASRKNPDEESEKANGDTKPVIYQKEIPKNDTTN